MNKIDMDKAIDRHIDNIHRNIEEILEAIDTIRNLSEIKGRMDDGDVVEESEPIPEEIVG